MKGLLRTWAFFWKELRTVLRQKRLLGTLVLGPFLILLLFGLGFKGGQPPIRALLVAPADPAARQDVEQLRRQLPPESWQIVDLTADEATARAALERGEVDAVILLPEDPLGDVTTGQAARVTVLVNQIDPVRRAWTDYNTYVAESGLNRQIVTEALREGKSPTRQVGELTAQLKADADALQAELWSGNLAAARARAERMRANSSLARQATADAAGSLAASGRSIGARAAGQALAQLGARLDRVDAALGQLVDRLSRGDAISPGQLESARALQAEAGGLDDEAHKLAGIPAEVLVSPLEARTQNVAPVEPTYVGFYTPGVIALLLQHMCITLISLSIVRERLLGAIELFRVSPVPTIAIVIGKSLAYAAIAALLALILVVAVNRGIGVPVIGGVDLLWASIGAVIFASLGVGFLIATLSKSENQAVQMAMMTLIASVFFGGFFIQLATLRPFAQVVSYLLPVTYGIRDLQDVMLRGARPPDSWLLAPLGLGLVCYLIAFVRFRSELRPR
ncbi:MAG TPA: ABC transporter permease [Chloroflexota bacterium]|jgi:ABC-2 type transport system permease protein